MGRLSLRGTAGPGARCRALVVALAAGAALAAALPAQAAAGRIASLAPNLTELAFAAGAGSRLVAVSEYSDWPAAARALPRIGDAFRVDYERLVALRPDLVLAWEGGTPPGTIARLRQLGLPVAVIRVDSLDAVGAALVEIGRRAGVAGAAAQARQRYEARLGALRRQYAGRQRLRVFIQVGDPPLYTVSGRHLISEMAAICGGDNIFARLPALAPAVDVEAVVARDPEAILYTWGEPAAVRAAWARWPAIAAVRHGNVLEVPADLVARATPRALDGLVAVCDALETARSRRRGG